MAIDLRTPVIVGAAQVTDRIDDPRQARTPLELMVDALHSAAIDADSPGCLTGLDLIGVAGGLWRYTDPGRQVADLVRAVDVDTLVTAWSGHSPQLLLNDLAARIRAGEIDAAAVLGGEVNASRRRARRLGVDIRRDADTDLPPARQFGDTLVMATSEEEARGIDAPISVYPLLDSAIRYDRGESIDEHRRRLGGLWAGFNAVAVDNPHAAVRTPMTADEISTPSAANRLVGAPYTVAMNAHNDVDQASAVLVLSAERAQALGVPRDRWVFPLSGSVGLDTTWISERFDLHRAPVLKLAGEAALAAVGLGIDDLTHLDLYSCFPSSVQISTAELGISHDRPLTVTGGLTFAGGPFNNYSGQAIAALVHHMRERPGTGLVHANGGYATKHAFGIYGTEPPKQAFRVVDVRKAAAGLPTRTADHAYVGTATIEGYTVMHDRDNSPTHALVALRTPGDARTWGTTHDPRRLAAMTVDEHIGMAAEIDPDGLVAV